MDVIYHSMSTTWKNKMVEQDFNYTDSTIKEMIDFFETRVETWSPRKKRKNCPMLKIGWHKTFFKTLTYMSVIMGVFGGCCGCLL